MKIFVSLIFLFAVSHCSAGLLGLPILQGGCNKNQIKFNECISGYVKDALRKIIKNPISGALLPNLEPFRIQGYDCIVNGSLCQTKERWEFINFFGLASAKINNFEVDLDKKTIALEVLVEKLRMIHAYDYQGTFCSRFVNVSGIGNHTFENSGAAIKANFKPNSGLGVQSVRLVDTEVTWNTGPQNLLFTSENTEDAAYVTQIVNERFPEIHSEHSRAFHLAFAEAFQTQFNKFLSHVPLATLLGNNLNLL